MTTTLSFSRIPATALAAIFALIVVAALAAPAPASAKSYCKVQQLDLNTSQFIGKATMECHDKTEACYKAHGCAPDGSDDTCAYVCDCTDVGAVCPPASAAGSAAAADGASEAGGGTKKLIPRGIGDISLQALAGRFANIMIGISGSVALLMFVYGGFMMLTSAGDEQKVNSGKQAITWATIGLIVIFGAYAILSALFAALGIGT
jgi:hypothetical protein